MESLALKNITIYSLALAIILSIILCIVAIFISPTALFIKGNPFTAVIPILFIFSLIALIIPFFTTLILGEEYMNSINKLIMILSDKYPKLGAPYLSLIDSLFPFNVSGPEQQIRGMLIMLTLKCRNRKDVEKYFSDYLPIAEINKLNDREIQIKLDEVINRYCVVATLLMIYTYIFTIFVFLILILFNLGLFKLY